MPEKWKRLLLYGGADKKAYDGVRADIAESNRSSLIVYSAIIMVAMLAMVILSFMIPSIEANRIAYLCCTIVSAIMLLVMIFTKKENTLPICLCMYTMVALLFGFGIALGTFVAPKELSVSFPILMVAVPLLFTDVPLRMAVAQVTGIVVYTLAAAATQEAAMIRDNLVSVIPYGLVSILICAYMMQIKIQRHVLEHENRFLIESDQLTGLLNRRCFEQHTQLLRKNGCVPGMMVCAFDINGLKMVNDTLGHHAGDELIRGAANCIDGIYGAHGHCYRTGGDEFMAILPGGTITPEELRRSLNDRCACFKGTYVSGLSISVGAVIASQDDDVDSLIKSADKAMYEDKDRYYRESGLGRRGTDKTKN